MIIYFLFVHLFVSSQDSQNTRGWIFIKKMRSWFFVQFRSQQIFLSYPHYRLEAKKSNIWILPFIYYLTFLKNHACIVGGKRSHNVLVLFIGYSAASFCIDPNYIDHICIVYFFIVHLLTLVKSDILVNLT